MQIRFLEYLIALDRERHFSRAARLCNVSQPTLSSGLAALEEQLGTRLVERDRRFVGLTAEGTAVLPWAQQLVSAYHNMGAAAAGARGSLTGTLRIGSIPAAIPVLGHLARAITAKHPALHIDFQTLTSENIGRALHSFELDAGVTYVDHEPHSGVIAAPLYEERFLFLADAGHDGVGQDSISLQRAIAHPLCLLHQGMQNRRILDALLASKGLTAAPVVTADNYETLIAMTATGRFATFLPDSYRLLVPPWARAITLTPQSLATRIGLIVLDKNPLSAMAMAALSIARDLMVPDGFLEKLDR